MPHFPPGLGMQDNSHMAIKNSFLLNNLKPENTSDSQDDMEDDHTSVFTSIKKSRKPLTQNTQDFLKDQNSEDIVSYEEGNSKTFKGVPVSWH
jgi:hypothetical protein